MASDKQLKDIARHIDNRRELGDSAPPLLYRRDLLQRAKRSIYGLGFRDIAAKTNLSVNTVQQAFDGDAAKISTLRILADYFGIPWIALFDLDRKLTVDAPKVDRGGDEISIGYEKRFVISSVDPSIVSAESPRAQDPPTPKKALGSKAAGKGRRKAATK